MSGTYVVLAKEGIVNEPEAKRRAARFEVANTQAANKNAVLPKMLLMMQHMTQHSTKLIRWVALPSSGFKSPGKSPVLPSPTSMGTYENAVLDTVATPMTKSLSL